MISNSVPLQEDASHNLNVSDQQRDFLDTRGKSCPIPLFMTNARLKLMSPGEILEIMSDCASLIPDLQTIFRNRCRILGSQNNKNIYTVTLQKT